MHIPRLAVSSFCILALAACSSHRCDEMAHAAPQPVSAPGLTLNDTAPLPPAPPVVAPTPPAPLGAPIVPFAQGRVIAPPPPPGVAAPAPFARQTTRAPMAVNPNDWSQTQWQYLNGNAPGPQQRQLLSSPNAPQEGLIGPQTGYVPAQ